MTGKEMNMKINTLLFTTSFFPVAVFKTIARIGAADLAQARLATAVGFVLAVTQFILAQKFIGHTSYLERAFLGYLAIGAAWVYLTPTHISGVFVNYSTAILYFVLFLTTLLPQLFGYDPFTYIIAKQWQPEAVWSTPQFRTINLHITYFFSGLFFLAFLSCLLGQGKPIFAIVIPLILIIGIGIPFSRRYPAYYIKNSMTATVADPATFPKTAQELINRMPTSFDAAAAGDLKADIQFRLSGEAPCTMFLSISDGKCVAHKGEAESPALTIIAPADIWMKMSRGEINRPKALMDGLYTVEGDTNLLIRMAELFQPPPAKK
jgi:putative sterol carrier protein